jgi:hypothetical protein
MKLKDVMLADIRKFPSLYPNKLELLSGYFLATHDKNFEINFNEWPVEELLSVEEAIEHLLLNDRHIYLFEDGIMKFIELKQNNDFLKIEDYLKIKLKGYCNEIKTIIHSEEIINNPIDIDNTELEIAQIVGYPSLKEDLVINYIPDNISDDWLEGLKELMNYFLNSNIPSVVAYRTEYQTEFNKIIERIKEIENINKKN